MNKLQYLTLALALIALICCAALEVQFRRFQLQTEQFVIAQVKINASQQKLNAAEYHAKPDTSEIYCAGRSAKPDAGEIRITAN